MTADTSPVGVIAGSGRSPFLVAEGVHKAGRQVVMLALRGAASSRLSGLADVFAWSGLTRLGRWISFFHAAGVNQVVMIGGVGKREMHRPLRVLRHIPDIRTAKLWYGKLRGDKRDGAVLLAVADELASEGIELVSSIEYCKEHLADEGQMTRTGPACGAAGDVEFGWRIARASADLDIGQSVAVRERDIIAVEAVEGTDEMIRRAGRLCPKGGWTLVKVARPDQDMRFDVPTIGPQTIKNLSEAGCRCVVVEAGKTVIVDKPVALDIADRLGVAVVGKSSLAERGES